MGKITQKTIKNKQTSVQAQAHAYAFRESMYYTKKEKFEHELTHKKTGGEDKNE